jgi:hypothetical protein
MDRRGSEPVATIRCDVEHMQTARRAEALNQIVPHDGWHTAEAAREGIYELQPRLVGVHVSHALDPAGHRLHEDRSVRAKAWFFRADLAIVILTGVELLRLEQLEIGETPHLIRQAAKNILGVHGGVGRHDSIQFGEGEQTVGG